MNRYEDARQAYGREGKWSPDLQAKFQEAFDAFDGATKADPKRFDAWMRLGYSAQYLAIGDTSKRDAAAAAYERAIDVDGERDEAMRGLSAVYRNDGSKWTDEVLPRLVKAHPRAPIVLYYQAYSLAQQKRTADAEKAYRAYVAAAKRPARGYVELGKLLLEAKKDAEGAKKAFLAGAEAEPNGAAGFEAVDWLIKGFFDRMGEAATSPTTAKAFLEEMESYAKLTPKNLTMHQNIGFFLRETSRGGADRAMLDASVRHYLAACELIGPFREDLRASVPYGRRHTYAQILNDTGLMYHYYDSIRDLAKAESYYRQAQDWSEFGYWDAYTNLMKILEAQQRYEDAVDYAGSCAEGLKNEDGTPNETYRQTARGDAARMESKVRK
jgi:tetratricopeptide (TPR) repeat protein